MGGSKVKERKHGGERGGEGRRKGREKKEEGSHGSERGREEGGKEGRHGRENVKGRRDGLVPRQRVIVMHFE